MKGLKNLSLQFILLSFFITLTAGCTLFEKDKSFYSFKKSKLHKLMKSNLRTVKIYKDLETEAIVDAILLDSDIEREYAKLVRELESSSSVSYLKPIGSNDPKITDFILAIYTPDKSSKHLTDPNSKWHISLDTKTRKNLKPAKISSIRYDNFKARDHLPFEEGFRKLYILSFDNKQLEKSYYRMEIASLASKGKLNWN